ncbi:MAG: AAA family ATPase, partial [Nanoarchaeota archaeon]
PYLPTEVVKRWYWKNIKLKPTAAKGNLVLNWTRVFCWHDDPFKPELLYPVNEFLVLDKEKRSALNRFLVKQEQFGTIVGEEGSGKTALLHWIQWELESHHPEVVPCLISASDKKIHDTELIKQLMLPFLNIYQKTVSRPFEEMKAEEISAYIKDKVRNKPFVLLIDEPYNISEKGLDLLAALPKAGVVFQLIVAGGKEELKKSFLGKGLKDTLKFELDGLDTSLTMQLLQKRIEAVGGTGTYPFDQQTIKMLHDHAKGNPLKILELAKEKVIQLTIDHHEEIVVQQQEIIHAQEEAAQRKAIQEKQKRIEEREKIRNAREQDREKHLQDIERRHAEEEKKQIEELSNEDAQLDKIDEVIGLMIEKKETKGKASKEDKEEQSEIKKHEELIFQVVGKVPQEKNVHQVLTEDPTLARDLEQVFAETEKAQKGNKKKR